MDDMRPVGDYEMDDYAVYKDDVVAPFSIFWAEVAYKGYL